MEHNIKINEEVNLKPEYIVKHSNDILDELNLSKDEKFICNSIISNLEKTAAKAIKEDKIAQLPYIGCIRYNPVRKHFIANIKGLSIKRKCMTKENYKNYIREYIYEAKEIQKAKDRAKFIYNRIKSKNKKQYEVLFKKLGRAYAEMFILSIYLLDEVPYNAEWEEQYIKLNNLDKDKKSDTDVYAKDNNIKGTINNQVRYKFK